MRRFSKHYFNRLNLSQLVEKMEQAGKIDAFQQVCGVLDRVLVPRHSSSSFASEIVDPINNRWLSSYTLSTCFRERRKAGGFH